MHHQTAIRRLRDLGLGTAPMALHAWRCDQPRASFLISIYTFGWTAHLDYLRVLAFLSRRGEALIENNSVNGILNALLGTGNPLVWDLHKFPPYSPIVHGGTLAAAILLVVASVWRRQGQNAYNALLDFQIAAMAYTMEAPIAWEHHYGIMPPVFATLFCVLSAKPEGIQRRRQLIALGAVFFVSAICITSSKYTVPTQLNLAHGYLFFAGLALIVMLWRASAQAQEPIALSGDVEPARGNGYARLLELLYRCAGGILNGRQRRAAVRRHAGLAQRLHNGNARGALIHQRGSLAPQMDVEESRAYHRPHYERDRILKQRSRDACGSRTASLRLA